MATPIGAGGIVPDARVVPVGGGVAFEDGENRGRIIVSSLSTGGAYSVMEWVVAPGTRSEPDGFGPHRHGAIEETFLVRSGTLEFLIDETITVLSPGDFVRVPPGVRHGYRNTTAQPADLVVTFVPGGFEELFVKYRSDQDEPGDDAAFIADATRNFDSTFE